MQRTTFHGRKAVQIENDRIRITMIEEGGHIAEILNKSTGVSPLWIPPWPSIEPSAWPGEGLADYGSASEAVVLGSIMGHSLCLDLFGSPSADEERSGVRLHGEAGLLPWEFGATRDAAVGRCVIANSQLAFERELTLDGPKMTITETVKNLGKHDRPIAWTQHVSLGPPFLERGKTQFIADTASGCRFCDWRDQKVEPVWEETRGGLREALREERSAGGFRPFLMNKDDADCNFVAWSPGCETAIAYTWKRSDFPWLGVWDENGGRGQKPWNARTLARGMEFGVTPFPATRREMVELGPLFDTPTCRWVPAEGSVTVAYDVIVVDAKSMPASFADCAALLRPPA